LKLLQQMYFLQELEINIAEGLAGVVIAGDANVAVTGSRINVTEGLAGVQIKGDANVTVTGRQLKYYNWK
jgi:hypothetical protein